MSILKSGAGLMLVFMVCINTLAWGASTNSNSAFSSPAHITAMPKSWSEKDIKYEKKHRDADLVVTLGQQTYYALSESIKQFARENKINIAVYPGSCGISAGRLIRKKVDIAAYCCPPGKTDRLPGLEFHTIAIAPIALIVNKENPILNLTMEEARDIFRGKLHKWEEIMVEDGNQTQVNPVGRLHCKVRPGHWRALLNDESQFSSSLFEVGVIPDMFAQIKDKRSAIGYETAYMIKHHGLGGKVKTISIDGRNPHNLKHLAQGKYPLYRTYSLTTWRGDNDKSKLARKLVHYLSRYVEQNHKQLEFIPTSHLKKAGWVFTNDELTGAPEKAH